MSEKCDNPSEAKISLKSIKVKDLFKKNFFVPSYQRGYRWTKQEVKDLLDDIYEFNKGENGGEFYCLQPLVVKRKEEEHSYEVIDGQQRLTTVFIILKFLRKSLGASLKNNKREPQEENNEYGLTYETREKSEGFLKNIGNQPLTEETGSPEDNIDFFHMNQAYKTIEDWFNQDFVPTTEPPDKERFLLRLLNNIEFIWYETDESDPIKVFTRLNIGKIPLTNAELIKALFLNSSNFHEKGDHLELRQREIASEWDQIEYTLQNKEFWLFIHNKGYNNPTRIDFIFDIICERESGSVNTTGIDSYRTFRHFYKSFKNAKKANKCIKDAKKYEKEAEKYIEKAKKLIEDVKWKIGWKKIYGEDEVKEVVDEVEKEIEKCDTIYRWKEVKKIFQTFNEWFNDLELYHYVGYLVAEGEKIKGLYKDWTESKNKNDFVENKLKEKIKKKIENKFDSNNEELDKTECRPLLLLHNIQTVINQCKNSTKSYGMQVFHKFPFHIYKNESWDVEHIDSNTPNDLNKPKDQRGWLFAIKDKVKDKNILGRMKSFYNNKNPGADDFESLKGYIEEILEEKTLEGDDKSKEKNKKLSQEDKNKIWNFALLDSSTNRGYGNSIFSAKRRCIIGKDKGKEIILPDEWDGELKEEDAESSFIPPCTKYVFLKYYSPDSSDPNYWTKQDAEKYRYNIFETLKEFGVKNADKSTGNTNKGDEDEQK